MSTITRHLQVETISGTIKVFGDKGLVEEFGKRFQREKFPCDYKERQGGHDSMISTISAHPQFSFEYINPSDHNVLDDHELLKMEVIHILEDEGFKIINTLFVPERNMERIMMCKELQQ